MTEGIDRYELLERTHSALVRLSLTSHGATVSLVPSVSQGKPGSAAPNSDAAHELSAVEGPARQWLAGVESKHRLTPSGPTIERFHAAIVAATEGEANGLVDVLGQLEKRMGIEWKGGRHIAAPSESADETRARMHRLYLHRHFGKATTTAAIEEGISVEAMRYIRRSHGISGRDGTRKEECPEAIVAHAVKPYCFICQVVDDLALQRELGHKRGQTAA